MNTRHIFIIIILLWPDLTLDDADAVGVAGAEGAEGREAPLWEAEEEERVGEAFREPGLERRPLEREMTTPTLTPCGVPSGRMNFSLSSRLVRPRAEEKRQGKKTPMSGFVSPRGVSSSRGRQRQRAE